MRDPFKYLGTVAAAASFVAATSVQAADDKAGPESFLIVQHAVTATLKDGMLVLDGADGQVVVFADRPHHAAATIPLADLVQSWHNGADSFAEDPPNAALIGQSKGQPVSLIVELQDPKLTGDTLTFEYTLIDGQKPTVIDQPYMVIDNSWISNLGGQLQESYDCTIGLDPLDCGMGAAPTGSTD